MRPSLADGGIETDLIYHHNQELPQFAAFVLLDDERGREVLASYYRPYLDLAARSGLGLVLETPTWRASADWLRAMGRDPATVAQVNRAAVQLVAGLRADAGLAETVMVSGCVGPRSDEDPAQVAMSAEDAQRYHATQVDALADAGADRVASMTMAYPAEAIGFVRAAVAADIPVVPSFTVETSGLLPDGTALADAVRQVDEATAGAADSFMVNCAHPSHIAAAVHDSGLWRERISGLRANASTRSHAELDRAADLDEGDPVAFAGQILALRTSLPSVRLFGGCCGTDIRHLTEVARAMAEVTWLD